MFSVTTCIPWLLLNTVKTTTDYYCVEEYDRLALFNSVIGKSLRRDELVGHLQRRVDGLSPTAVVAWRSAAFSRIIAHALIALSVRQPEPTYHTPLCDIILCTARFGRLPDIFAVPEAEFMAESITNILVKLFIPLCGYLYILMSYNSTLNLRPQ